MNPVISENAKTLLMTEERTEAVIIASVIILLVLGFFYGMYVVYHYVFRSPHRGQNDTHMIPSIPQYGTQKDIIVARTIKLENRPCEEVIIRSYDGLSLYGKYYHVRDGAPVDIAFHGYRGTSVRDLSSGINISFETGHNVLLIEHRAHCRSQGRTITFGDRESRDCISWINYVIDRFGKDTEIVIFGVSMGAATVLMAIERGLPDNVKGIMADSPFTSPAKIVRAVMRERKLPMVLYPFVWIAAFLYGHFNLGAINSAEAVKKTKVPVLLFHGEADSFVPCYMSREIQAANPEMVTLKTFKNSDHAFEYMIYRDEYMEAVDQYYDLIHMANDRKKDNN